MKADELRECLKREGDAWSAKSCEDLAHGTADGPAYEVDGRYQVEIVLLERTADYVHVSVSVDAGGWRQFVPLAASLIVHRDGRVQR
jgi:hypothetical protein